MGSPRFDVLWFAVVVAGVTAIVAILHGHRRVVDARSELLRIVLGSMGVRVVAVGGGRLVCRGPSGEKLVGWKQVEAAGRPVDAEFRLVGEDAPRDASSPLSATSGSSAPARHAR